MKHIQLAESETEYRKCFPIIVQLRTHLSEPQFLAALEVQQHEGYKLAYLESENEVRAVAGFRVIHNLAWGKILYVDDLVTDSNGRSKGFGGDLFDWLVDYARHLGCEEFHLDSGVQRFAAHRFYLLKRMEINCHHFGMKLRS